MVVKHDIRPSAYQSHITTKKIKVLLLINALYVAYNAFVFSDLFPFTYMQHAFHDSYKTSLRPECSKLYCSQVNEQFIQILSSLIVPYGEMKHDYYSK